MVLIAGKGHEDYQEVRQRIGEQMDAIREKVGEDELTLVRSGLDDTMRGAYGDMRQLWHERLKTDPDMDLRTAAFMISIGRVADSYRSLGL